MTLLSMIHLIMVQLNMDIIKIVHQNYQLAMQQLHELNELKQLTVLAMLIMQYNIQVVCQDDKHNQLDQLNVSKDHAMYQNQDHQLAM